MSETDIEFSDPIIEAAEATGAIESTDSADLSGATDSAAEQAKELVDDPEAYGKFRHYMVTNAAKSLNEGAAGEMADDLIHDGLKPK